MSRKIAFAGIFTGIAVILLYMGAIMPTGKLTLYFLASLPVAFSIIEYGTGTGIILYIAASILSVLLSGNIPGIVPYILFFGHYPIIKFYIEKKRRWLIELILKFAVFNSSMLLWYLLFKNLFFDVVPVQLNAGSMMWVALIAIMQILFLIYDYLFSGLLFYYESKLGIFKRR